MPFIRKREPEPTFVRAIDVRDEPKPEEGKPAEPVFIEYLRSSSETAPYGKGDFRKFERGMCDEVRDLLIPTGVYEWDRPDGTDEDPLDRGELRKTGEAPWVRIVTEEEILERQRAEQKRKAEEAARADAERVLILFLRSWGVPTPTTSHRLYNAGDTAAFPLQEAKALLAIRGEHRVEGVVLLDSPICRPATRADLKTHERKRREEINAWWYVKAMRVKAAGGGK